MNPLPSAFAHVKPNNTSEDWLNIIQQTVYSLYRVKEIRKKGNIISSV